MKYELFLNLHKENLKEEILDFIEIAFYEDEKYEIFEHMEFVASMAVKIGAKYKIDEEQCYLAGFLHDLGRVIDKEEYEEILGKNNYIITDQEKENIILLHGMMSGFIAKTLFKIEDELILLSLTNHVTLRANPTNLEKVVFIADKLSWDNQELNDIIEETVLQSLNVTCHRILVWLIEDIKKKSGVVLDKTTESFKHFDKMMF